MEAQAGRRLFKNNLISDISYQDRRTICMMLDSRDDWKKIVGLIKAYDGTGPRYDDIHIMMFERETSRQFGSPTDCLLNDWRSIRPKIGDLMEVLVCAQLINVANYLSEKVLLEGRINMPVTQPGLLINVLLVFQVCTFFHPCWLLKPARHSVLP